MLNYLEGIQGDPVWKTNSEPTVTEVISKIRKLQNSTSTNREENKAISIVVEWLNEVKE